MRQSGLIEKIIKANPNEKRPAKWGLVLSGGGTKGAYEVGAWKAIRELRVPIRGIAGTSIGALNAAMFLGCSLKEIENIYKKISISDVLPVDKNIDPDKSVFARANILAISREYLQQRGLTNEPLRKMLVKHLDAGKIYNSPLDLGIVTYNIRTREAFQLFKEDIAPEKLFDYLLASANFPIYKTQIVDGKQFMDGGFYDNMPLNPMIERGYTHLIAIDINGMGMKRKVENADKIYLKVISCSENLGGTFEFNHARIKHNIKLGYLDTMKAFHKLFGTYYFFRRPAFNDLLLNFDLNTIRGLEIAGKLLEVDRLRIYRAEDFLSKLEDRIEEKERGFSLKYKAGFHNIGVPDLRRLTTSGDGLPAFVQIFIEQPTIRGSSFIKAFPEMAQAANAVIALKNYRKL